MKEISYWQMFHDKKGWILKSMIQHRDVTEFSMNQQEEKKMVKPNSSLREITFSLYSSGNSYKNERCTKGNCNDRYMHKIITSRTFFTLERCDVSLSWMGCLLDRKKKGEQKTKSKKKKKRIHFCIRVDAADNRWQQIVES